MSDYIFDEHRQDQELDRLRMIEELFDPATNSYLERAGLRAGLRCLELGAGAGSVMKRMGRIAGENGAVVGIDKNATYLREFTDPPYQVAEGDFLEIPVGDTFDLAHCRYVLIHNLRGDEMLRKLCGTLKPGGALVVEEPDFTSCLLPNQSGDEAYRRVNNAICRLFEEMELNPGYGLTVPEKLAGAGLQIAEVDSRNHLARGGSLMARMMAASTRALAEKYVSTGEASMDDIAGYIRNTTDKQFWSIYYSTTSVVATKPSA